MNQEIELFINYLKNKDISLTDDDSQKIKGYKECIKDSLVVLESFAKKDDLDTHLTTFVGIIAKVKKELYNFFQIKFISNNNLNSVSRRFTDESLENLVERIYKIVEDKK